MTKKLAIGETGAMWGGVVDAAARKRGEPKRLKNNPEDRGPRGQRGNHGGSSDGSSTT